MWKVIKSFAPDTSEKCIPSGDEFYLHFYDQSHPKRNSNFEYSLETEAITYLESVKYDTGSIPSLRNPIEYDILKLVIY